MLFCCCFSYFTRIDPSSTHKFKVSKLLDGLHNRVQASGPPVTVAAPAPKAVDLDDAVALSLRQAFSALVDSGRARSLFDAFRAADHGKKGSLSVDDFQDACDAAGFRIKQSDIRKVVEKFDMNGDGFVDLEEFISFLDASGRMRAAADDKSSAPAARSTGAATRLAAHLASIRKLYMPTICDRMQVTRAGCDEAVSMLRAAFTRYDSSRRGVVGTRDVASVLSAHGVGLAEEDIAALRSAFRVRSPTVASTEVDYTRLSTFLVGSASSSDVVLLAVDKDAAARDARRPQTDAAAGMESAGGADLDDQVLAAFSSTHVESLGSWLRTVSVALRCCHAVQRLSRFLLSQAASPVERRSLLQFLGMISQFENKLGMHVVALLACVGPGAR